LTGGGLDQQREKGKLVEVSVNLKGGAKGGEGGYSVGENKGNDHSLHTGYDLSGRKAMMGKLRSQTQDEERVQSGKTETLKKLSTSPILGEKRAGKGIKFKGSFRNET